MRVWGRVNGQWQAVNTDPSGDNTNVMITVLVQCLLLNLGESPFWANYGIPAQQSVNTQLFPDFYVALTQQQFAPFFASLIIRKIPSTKPSYAIRLIKFNGALYEATVPI